MVDARPATLAVWVLAAVHALLGGVLVVGGTLGWPGYDLLALAVGLVLLPAAVALVGVGTYIDGPRAYADRRVVNGGMLLHMAALLATVLTAGRWLLYGGSDAGTIALLWGVAAVAYVGGAFVYDRRCPTDVEPGR